MGLFNKKKGKGLISSDGKTAYSDSSRTPSLNWGDGMSTQDDVTNSSMEETVGTPKLLTFSQDLHESNSAVSPACSYLEEEKEDDDNEDEDEDEDEDEKEEDEEKQTDSTDEFEFKVFDEGWSLVDEFVSCLDDRKKEREQEPTDSILEQSSECGDEDSELGDAGSTELDTPQEGKDEDVRLRLEAENARLYLELEREKMRCNILYEELQRALRHLHESQKDQRKLEEVCFNLTKSSADLEEKFKVEMTDLKGKYKKIQQIMSKCQSNVSSHQEKHPVIRMIENANSIRVKGRTDYLESH